MVEPSASSYIRQIYISHFTRLHVTWFILFSFAYISRPSRCLGVRAGVQLATGSAWNQVDLPRSYTRIVRSRWADRFLTYWVGIGFYEPEGFGWSDGAATLTGSAGPLIIPHVAWYRWVGSTMCAPPELSYLSFFFLFIFPESYFPRLWIVFPFKFAAWRSKYGKARRLCRKYKMGGRYELPPVISSEIVLYIIHPKHYASWNRLALTHPVLLRSKRPFCSYIFALFPLVTLRRMP